MQVDGILQPLLQIYSTCLPKPRTLTSALECLSSLDTPSYSRTAMKRNHSSIANFLRMASPYLWNNNGLGARSTVKKPKTLHPHP